MDAYKKVSIAWAEGIANGWIVQTDTGGIALTAKGEEHSRKLWDKISDIDRLLLAGYIGKLIKGG